MSLLTTLASLLCLGGSDSLVVDNFGCLDQNGNFQRLYRHADAKLVVLYVYANDCPIVRHSAGELRDLMTAFEPRGVRFLGLDPASPDDRASVATEASELGLAFPILLDDTQCAAEMLEVKRTGEALVISTTNWALLWRGPLDDRLDYGVQKNDATRHYLREALEALLEGASPPEGAPLPKGCAVTFLQPRKTHEVDYARDVAPILVRSCLPCHCDGGIGPWSMNGYERVRGFSAMMREVVLERRMSPWHPDPMYGRFKSELGLSPEDMRTLVHWIERGAPRGEGEDVLAKAAEPLPEWPLGPPDLVLEVPEQKIPATGSFPYRKPEVQLDLETDRWVRAVDLRPSNPAVLHHAFFFIRVKEDPEEMDERLERLPPERRAKVLEWLEKKGNSLNAPPEAMQFFDSRAFAWYGPGQGIDEFPAGTGKLMPAKATLAFQLHYVPNGVATTDRPRVGLYFHKSKPERELKVTTAANTSFVLPPGERAVPVNGEHEFRNDVRLYAMFPHMHYRGRSMRLTAVLPDGTREVLLSVPEFSFDFQAMYRLVEPRFLPAGTRLVCDAVYDNSKTNESNPDPTQAVRWGAKSSDEMFLGYALYTVE
jgi:peroxiredoxin